MKFSNKKNSQYWHKTRHLKQWNGIENTNMSGCNCKHMILTKMSKNLHKCLFNGWKTTMCNLMLPETTRRKHRQYLTRCRFGKERSEYKSIFPSSKANNWQVEFCKHEMLLYSKGQKSTERRESPHNGSESLLED